MLFPKAPGAGGRVSVHGGLCEHSLPTFSSVLASPLQPAHQQANIEQPPWAHVGLCLLSRFSVSTGRKALPITSEACVPLPRCLSPPSGLLPQPFGLKDTTASRFDAPRERSASRPVRPQRPRASAPLGALQVFLLPHSACSEVVTTHATAPPGFSPSSTRTERTPDLFVRLSSDLAPAGKHRRERGQNKTSRIASTFRLR